MWVVKRVCYVKSVEYVCVWEKKRLFVNIEMIFDVIGNNICIIIFSFLFDILVGDFVVVKLSVGRGYNIYMVEVLELEEDGKEVYLKYMKKCSGDLYVWLNFIDEFWEFIVSIICIVGYLEFVNKRELFRFSVIDMVKV